jgi:hypothetical protein
MKAEIRRFHSPDAEDLRHFAPSDPLRFAVLIQVMIGPQGLSGEESFDILVCSPSWIAERARAGKPVWGRHHLITERFDFAMIEGEIRAYVEACEADNWRDLALLLGRIGKWEFEDYA